MTERHYPLTAQLLAGMVPDIHQYSSEEILMAWDWDKLQQQRQGRQGGTPPQMDEILSKIRNMKGRFPGGFIIIVIVIA